ncbi:esterase [Glycocaulis alkaliphilus]|uniref:Esterase n=1 Tax=Glycocaulis alkaliphilus TaxID=1434191 RepID=A0A3T0EBK2_9PROT|nr:alpha/beta hydrolase-fold protein [Glycocaulis alkaliphilus]AZU04801.1 esterase [Glycocaulis alkaliphilus]GGB67556.1 hypothetical protein GCM10007417_04220 [Glycocaulis alkaliphilus]
MMIATAVAASLLVLVDSPDPDLLDYPYCSAAEAFDPAGDADLALRREIALDACRLPLALSLGDVESMLGDEDFAFEIDGEELVAARRGSGANRLHGALNASLPELEGTDGIHAARFRLAELQAAWLKFYVFPEGATQITLDMMPGWEGPDAPPKAVVENDGGIEGELIATELWSEALGETRRLYVYLPPGHDPAASYPAVFFGDGGVVNHFGRLIEPRIADGSLPPMVLVGAESGQQGIVEDRSDVERDLRNADYLPGGIRGVDRFDAHLIFFADELVEHAITHWGASPDPVLRGVFGRSSGGAFSLQAGFRRPDRFGHAFSMSTGRGPVREADPAPENAARFYFAAGLYEPTFLYNAHISANALQAAGYEVRIEALAAGHTQEIDEVMLIPFLRDAFGVD